MKRHLIFGCALVFTFQFATASNCTNSTNFIEGNTIFYPVLTISETPKEKWEAAIGTFQFEILEGRKLTEIDITIIDEIEKNRHATEITYIQYNDQIRIKILPLSTINSAFVKLDLRKTVTSFELNN